MPNLINNDNLTKNIFLKSNLISEKDILSIDALAANSGDSFETTLINAGILSEKDYYEGISEYLKIPLLNTSEFPEEPVLLNGEEVEGSVELSDGDTIKAVGTELRFLRKEGGDGN